MKGIAASLLATAISLISLVSCSKEEPKPPLHLSVSEYEVEFTKEASHKNVNFCFIGDWATTETSSDWVKSQLMFDNSEDGHMESLSITVTENTTGQDRTATVTVSTIREGNTSGSIADRIDRVITVIQKGE